MTLGPTIGLLAVAVAVAAGTTATGKGVTLIAGQCDVELQAQADTMQVAARVDVEIHS